MGGGQDWSTVAFSNKPPPRPQSARGPGGGGPSGSTPRGPSSVAKNGMSMSELEADTDNLGIAKVSNELKKAIQQARMAKKMNQKELAAALQIDAKTINEYESGKAIPNNQLIAKMERTLGAKLPRAPKGR